MKKLILAIAMAIPMALFAQDDYTMYETVPLSPNGEDFEKLTAAMKAHNKKFHSTGAHTATVWSVSTGPNAGKLIWMMGPLKYADLDTRPKGDAHDEDWANVIEHIDEAGTVEYWKRDDKLSYLVEGDPSPMVYVRYWKVNNKYGFLVNGLLKQVSAVVKEMKEETSWQVYDNEFRQGDMGRHMATVGGMKSWAALDDDDKFRETFIQVHGEGSWIPFVRTMGLAFEDSWDEIWTVEPGMGGTD